LLGEGLVETKVNHLRMDFIWMGLSAINWIIESRIVKEKDIILYGESLGTGIATEIAQNKNFAGLF
jgi:surfactin synthase thioesterase subunit